MLYIQLIRINMQLQEEVGHRSAQLSNQKHRQGSPNDSSQSVPQVKTPENQEQYDQIDNEDISDLDNIDDIDLDDAQLDDDDLNELDGSLDDSDLNTENDQDKMESGGFSNKEIKQKRKKKESEAEIDVMSDYENKERTILQWCKAHPGQQWTDPEFPSDIKQFYKDQLNAPAWASEIKNIEWKRPQEMHKDPKFMLDDEKGLRYIDCDAKQGVIAQSWFVGVLTILAGRGDYISKLIVEKSFFDNGFVSFQFFKNGGWRQVIVDTVLPYEKESSSRTSVYSNCSNPQQFWISLMEKAYVKLHGCYQKICEGCVFDGLVDLTGGICEGIDLKSYQAKKMVDNGQLWSSLMTNFNLKYYIGCINRDEKKSVKAADQGQQGILENHYYSILDLKEFQKQNLKLVRIRNPWGSDGLWNGAFCEDSDDWDKHRSLKNQLEGVAKTNKSQGAWWMSFSDWCQQYSNVYITKIFPSNWENYSIQGRWMGKTNGGTCPQSNYIEKESEPPKDKQKSRLVNNAKVRAPNKGFCPPKMKLQNTSPDLKKTLTKTKGLKTKFNNQQPQYLQLDTDDKWFNNPQYRIKVHKDTKLYISLMLEDQRLTGVPYVPYNFMVVATKSRTERIWERPYPEDVVLESNPQGSTNSQREVAVSLTLKRQHDKPYGIYMIIPNILDFSVLKKEQKRNFYLRIFASEPIDVVQMPETQETTVEGLWTQDIVKGRRRIDDKDNADWCRNPQYFLNLTQPTQLKIILRKNNAKKLALQWKIGMTICRLNNPTKKLAVQKIQKKSSISKTNSQFNNLQRLLQQTSEYLQAPVMEDIERKLFVLPEEKFKESDYSNSDVAALYYNLNPAEGPFVIIPSIEGDNKEPISVGYKLTIFSNNPIQLQQLDQDYNAVLIGKWEKDLSAGGCHLYQRQKEGSQRTWSQNPKYQLMFKSPVPDKKGFEQAITEANLEITLAIVQKNWKKQNPNTVGRMIGLYLLNKKQGKLVYNQQLVEAQTNFLPVNINTLSCMLGGQKEISKKGYIIMPSTYQSKIHGSFILSVKSNKPFNLTHIK